MIKPVTTPLGIRALDDRAAVRRLFDRFGFGPRPGEFASAAGRGFDATLAAMLDPGDDPGARSTPPPALEPEPEKPDKPEGGKPGKEARKRLRQLQKDQVTAITAWWLDRMVLATKPAAERITWFWHGHFATSAQKVRSARLMLAQNETLRRLGAGPFAPLAKAMVVDPAMLVWLDGQKNRVGAPNENLAREFMELFTLGVGHYTEDDVKEAARALTGWRVDRATGEARQVPRQHDDGPKAVLGASGPFDAASLVDLLLTRPECARFVAQRMWHRLVSTEPAPPEAIQRLAAAYGPGKNTLALLKGIAAEPAFRDAGTSMVKQPVEWLVGLCRAVGVRPGALPDKIRVRLLGGMRGMGQVPFLPPSVGGWPSGSSWLTTSSALTRLQVAQLVAQHADLRDLTAAAAQSRVDGVRNLLAVDGWSERTVTALRQVQDDPKQLVAVAACAPEYVVSA